MARQYYYSDLGHCQDCGREWVLKTTQGQRAYRSMDMGRHAGLVCLFCGSSRVTIKKEKTHSEQS